MKLTILTTSLAAVMVSIALSSNSSGPATEGNGNRTGSPGSTGSCTGCHNGGSGTTAGITVKRKSNNADAGGKYIPGEAYLVTLAGNHSSLTRYGFQIVAQKAGNAQAGTWQVSGDAHTKTVSGLTIVEHHHMLSKTGSAFTNTIEWIAPAKGTGSVGIYGIINAVNDDANTSGDAVSPTASVTLNEDPLGINDINTGKRMAVFPNPVSNTLYISAAQNLSGISEVKIVDLDGKVVFERQVTATTGSPVVIPVSDLAKGIYQISVVNGELKQSSMFIKK